jgi:hypothetical protein
MGFIHVCRSNDAGAGFGDGGRRFDSGTGPDDATAD